jgi:hypothetical protein
MGDDQCADDWCIAVAGVQRTGMGDAGSAYDVTFRVSSRARRATQRERNVLVYLRDADNRRFDPHPSSEAPPFDVQLGPLQAVTTVRRFVVPPSAKDIGLIVTRSGFPFPDCCIIGADASLFHKKTIVRLE